MVSPEEIELPTDIEQLACCYVFLDEAVASIWRTYIDYYTDKRASPARANVLRVVFNEIEFYEIILTRILSAVTMDEIHEARKKYGL